MKKGVDDTCTNMPSTIGQNSSLIIVQSRISMPISCNMEANRNTEVRLKRAVAQIANKVKGAEHMVKLIAHMFTKVAERTLYAS